MDLIPFSARSYLERVLVLSGLNEPQARQAAFAGVGGFDVTQWPKGKVKSYASARPRPPTHMTIHVTDVAGGFGVGKKRTQYWADRVIVGNLPEYLPPLPEDDVFLAAQRLALWERLKDQAYHQVACQNGDSLATRAIEDWSWHAGKWANTWACGFAVDCHHGEDLTDWLIDTGRAAMRALAHRMVARHVKVLEELRAPILVHPHRSTSGDRRVDPQGRRPRGVWTDIVIPVVESMAELEVDYELRKGNGRPVPDIWDKGALYDWRGRRVEHG